MRDSFVGDIGDFAKYGLLRHLCGVTDPMLENPLPLGVVWYYNQSPGPGGNAIQYLNVSDSNIAYEKCDSELYNILQREVGMSMVGKIKREVKQIKDWSILPSNTVYYEEPLQSSKIRLEWFNGALETVKNASVIFVDPDKGMDKNKITTSSEHISIGEIKDFYKNRKSLIIYQSLNHTKVAEVYAEKISIALKDALGLSTHPWALQWRRIVGRLFFIVVHPDHTDHLNLRVRTFVKNPLWFTIQPGFYHAHFKNLSLP